MIARVVVEDDQEARSREENLLGLIKWAGGKSSLAKILVPLIESRQPKRLVEPFAGGAAVFFRTPTIKAILGDTNANLIAFYSAVKDNPTGVSDALASIRSQTANLRGESFAKYYYDMRQVFPKSDLCVNAALFIFLNRHCWNGLYRENSQGRFNTPLGSCDMLQPMPNTGQLVRASGHLKRATLICGDFGETMAKLRVGDLVYLDPPYIPLSSTARFANYQGTSFGWRDHVRLKRTLYDLTDRGIEFVLSNSFQELSTQFYSDFYQYVVTASASINSRGSKRQPRQELLVTNFRSNLLRGLNA